MLDADVESDGGFANDAFVFVWVGLVGFVHGVGVQWLPAIGDGKAKRDHGRGSCSVDRDRKRDSAIAGGKVGGRKEIYPLVVFW